MRKTVFFTRAGRPKTGLAPTWLMLKKTEDEVDFTQPVISEIGQGQYSFDIVSADNLVGVITGNASEIASELSDDDRYKSFNYEVPYDPPQHEEQVEAFCTPTYSEDTDSLTFLAFLMINGRVIQTLLTSCTINVYDPNHLLLFTVTNTSQTNGVFVITKSNPTIVKNTNYYIEIEMTYDSVVYTSMDTFAAVE